MCRKLTICFLTALFLFSLVGCTEMVKDFKLFQKKANIVEIDRVLVTYPDGTKTPQIEVVQAADPEQLELIFRLLRKIPCKNSAIQSEFKPKNECFRILYKDQSYQLLAHNCNCYYSADNSFKDNDLCAFDFNRFIRTWDQGF